MKTCTYLLLAFTLTCAVSCSQIARGLPLGRGYTVPKRAMSYDANNKAYSAFISPTTYVYELPAVGDPGETYFRTAYENAKTPADKQGVRNQIAKELASLVDENHDIYHESLRRNLTGTSIISDFVTLGLTSSAAIVTGARSAKALAAIATGTTGFGSTINSQVLQQQTLSSLLKAISIRKDRIYAEMQIGFTKNTGDYGLEDVIKDLGRYWQAGLLTGAIAELDKLVSSTANNVENAKAENANKPTAEKSAAVVKAASR